MVAAGGCNQRSPGSKMPPAVEPAAKLSADDYYNLGAEAKDTEDKIKYYTKAIEINPYNAQFYYYRGLAYNKKNSFPPGNRGF